MISVARNEGDRKIPSRSGLLRYLFIGIAIHMYLLGGLWAVKYVRSVEQDFQVVLWHPIAGR